MRTLSLLVLLAGAAAAFPALAAHRSPHAGKTFRDCPDCILMIGVPAGVFQMGSPDDEAGRQPNEGPRRRVTIAHPFALSVNDVTRAQYARFVEATGHASEKPRCDWRNPASRKVPLHQTPNDPVVCVSWSDAQAYALWLAKETGKPYRLPREAEWEYAARAGTDAARPWGPNADHDLANTGADACCAPLAVGKDRWLYTSPVGSFPPNRFGLFDMVGDVWQWTQDCGSQDYSSPPPSVVADGCATHVVRGGGWFHPPSVARSASRASDETGLAVPDIGFRVARSL